jgi:DNA primase
LEGRDLFIKVQREVLEAEQEQVKLSGGRGLHLALTLAPVTKYPEVIMEQTLEEM